MILFTRLFALLQVSPHLSPVCPGFTVNGSVQEHWNDTGAGQTVTINCQKKHVRDGSSERTCSADAEWNNDAPLCRELGKSTAAVIW